MHFKLPYRMLERIGTAERLDAKLILDMHLFFIDDAGSISPGKKIAHNHFVLGGLVIPEDQWHNLERDFSQITKNFKIEDEIKPIWSLD
jgi:hypothetical protein